MKKGKNCKVIFLNNAIYDEDFYVLLTQTTTSKSSSSSSNNNTSSDNSSSVSSSSTSSTMTNDEYVSSTLKGEGVLGKILNWAGLTNRKKSKTKSSSQKVYIPANAYTSGSGWINAGVYLMKKEVLNTVPDGRLYSLEKQFFPTLVGEGLCGCQIGKRFIDIGTPESFATAEYFFKNLT